jgi:hypothetical protein
MRGYPKASSRAGARTAERARTGGQKAPGRNFPRSAGREYKAFGVAVRGNLDHQTRDRAWRPQLCVLVLSTYNGAVGDHWRARLLLYVCPLLDNPPTAHNAANEHLVLIARAENGPPSPQGLCQLDRPLKWPVGPPEAGGGALSVC